MRSSTSFWKADRKKLLDRGIETKLFMAPGHTFDKTTLRALKALGFTHVTDGFGDLPYVRSEMTFYRLPFCGNTHFLIGRE